MFMSQVAPVLDANITQRTVWFPPGPKCWLSYWDPARTYPPNATALVPASVDALPPAFRRCTG